MGKLDIDSSVEEELDGDGDDDGEEEVVTDKLPVLNKDMRRRLEDRLDEARLSRELREYDFHDC